MKTIDNIKDLFEQVNNRTAFIEMVANDLKKKPISLSKNWFCASGFWSIPDRYQNRVVELLQKTIASQDEQLCEK